MKKFFALPILLCCCGLYATQSMAGSCERHKTYRTNQTVYDDYLFLNPADFNSHFGWVCGKSGSSESTSDNPLGCDRNVKIAIKGHHLYGDSADRGVNESRAQIFVCVTDKSNDAWRPIETSRISFECPDDVTGYLHLEELDNDRQSIYCKEFFDNGTNAYCVDKDGRNLCYKKKCTNCGPTPTPTPTPTPVVRRGCAQFTVGSERRKCCDAGNQTEWIGDLATGHCKCKAKGTEWKSELGQCVGANGEPEMQKCTYWLKANAQCPNGAIIKKGAKIELNVPKNKGTCDEFKNNVREFSNDFKELIWEYCDIYGIEPTTPQNTPVITGPSQAEIDAAKASLNAFFQTAESDASVWKDADGNFNTARLASDLTAGVVLGTVGGVVSGVVIKKKQVEKGFDALNCSVGGQKIADWGDTFEVGLRR